MIQNFNGPVYFILFLILLAGNAYYAYCTTLNTKNWLDKYKVSHSAVLITRICGSIISAFVLIGFYILFTGTEGTWTYFSTLFIAFVLMTIQGIYTVEVDYPNNYKGKEGFEDLVITREGYIPVMIFGIITAIIIYGLSDKIYT